MSEASLQLDKQHDGQVVRLTLGPAPGNIVSAQAIDELSAELTRIDQDIASGAAPETKLVVITGAGEHFSYGASVEEHRAEVVGDMLPKFHRLIRQLVAFEVPTLARVTGLCLGGGFEVALACSLMFCERSARCAIPEIQLGVFPPPACVLLPLKVPDALACRMILTGKKVGAEELQRAGLVNEVCDDGSVDAAIDAFVRKDLAGLSASSLRFAHRASRVGLVARFDESIGKVEDLYLDALMQTKDAVEGIEAFMQKRKSRWVHA